MAGELVAILGRWRRRVGVGASLDARHRGFCSLALGWARWRGGIDGTSVVARWLGRGIVTALAPARWCRRRRDPTINNRWKVEGRSGEQSLHRVWGMILIVINKLRKTHQSRIPTPFVFNFTYKLIHTNSYTNYKFIHTKSYNANLLLLVRAQGT